jgi:hypothetical protein
MVIRSRRLFWGLAVVFSCAFAQAQTSDPAAARAQLQEGYALKQQGKCDAAILHFVESVRLDRQPKTLLNLADCEEKLGKLATAQSHLVEARDLAQAQRLGPLQALAEQRRQALEKRVPRLIVRLAKNVPAGTTVMRDGVELGPVSLNTALPTDPGKHQIVARGSNVERVYEIVVAEAETKEIEVTPVGGKQLHAAAPSAGSPTGATSVVEATPSTRTGTTAATRQPSEHPASSPASPTGTGPNGQRIAGVVVAGAGLVGAAVGGYFALRAQATYNAADCDPSNRCSEQGLSDQNRAFSQARNATFVTAGGLVALATGVVLWITAPASRSTDAAGNHAPRNRFWVSADPLGESGARSVTLGGVF